MLLFEIDFVDQISREHCCLADLAPEFARYGRESRGYFSILLRRSLIFLFKAPVNPTIYYEINVVTVIDKFRQARLR